ncbi:hypothetical protein [Anaerotignum faecicola]|uniref:hypothetical protein n=1 Tax=Anaerotignum faecicola TaxID=2358141 RepID=UPI001FAAF56A|nr:hypothetical protein [Anaerotignum faecicola]
MKKLFLIGKSNECRRETAPPQAALRSKVLTAFLNLQKSIFCRMAGSKGGIPL